MLCIFHRRVVHSGTQNSFSMPVMLSFWGKEENKSAVTDLMTRRGYKLNSGGSEVAMGANKGKGHPVDLTIPHETTHLPRVSRTKVPL